MLRTANRQTLTGWPFQNEQYVSLLGSYCEQRVILELFSEPQLGHFACSCHWHVLHKHHIIW